MKIFKNNTWIDTSVYNDWPEILDGCWIGIESISSEFSKTGYIIKNDLYPEHSINIIDFVPEEDDYIAIIQYGVVREETMIVKLEVKEDMRGRGIGQFFARYMWVWIMENNDTIVRMPYMFRNDIAEHMIAKYSVEYEVPYAVLRTVDGDYKPLKEIDDASEVWGVSTNIEDVDPI